MIKNLPHWALSAGILLILASFFFFAMRGYTYIGYTLVFAAVLVVLHRFLPQNLWRAALSLVCAGLIYFCAVELPIIANSRTDKDAKRDYLIVLGAAVHGDVPSLALQHRLEGALSYMYAYPESTAIVSQIGIAPIITLLEKKVDVILCGRACDTAIYAAPCIHEGYDPGLAFHMAKIMECGAMCSEPVAAADVMQAYMYEDHFALRPANPIRKCTVDRVAAHTLYEQSNPYLIFEPDGVCDLTNAKFCQADERTVRVSGSVFQEAEQKTLKLEGVKCSGYRTISPATIYDPETIRQFDYITTTVMNFVKENTKKTLPENSYTVTFKTNGGPESSLGIIIDVVGKTQEIADTVCALVRSRMLHCDYEGRKSSAGNLAFPFSPSDIHVGAVYEFSVFHLAKVDSLLETAKIEIEEVRA